MSADWLGTIFSVWTVVAAALFTGITVWAYSGGRRQEFEEAARLPLDDGDQAREGGTHDG